MGNAIPTHNIRKVYYISIGNVLIEDTVLERIQQLFSDAIDNGEEVSPIGYREETQRLKV